MAHTVINGAPLAVTGPDATIVEQITDVIEQIDHYVAEHLSIRDALLPLETRRADDRNWEKPAGH